MTNSDRPVLKGASPADKQASQVAKGIIQHEGKSAMTEERKDNGNGNRRAAAGQRRADDEDRNPVTGQKETHTRLATPEEGERIARGEKVTGRPGDEADRLDAKGKKLKSDAEYAADFIDPANAKADTKKSSKSGDDEVGEGEMESAEAANARVRRAATGAL